MKRFKATFEILHVVQVGNYEHCEADAPKKFLVTNRQVMTNTQNL